MSSSLRRRLIDVACHILQATLPASLRPWGSAIRSEAANIPDDTQAILYTLNSVGGLVPRAVASRLLRTFAPAGSGAPLLDGSTAMPIFNAIASRPRAIGVICASGAVALGVVYMVIAGAPTRYPGINAGALVIGLMLQALLGREGLASQRWTGAVTLAIASSLLATAILGAEVEGAARWVNIGGLAVQPSLVLLPAAIVAFSRNRSLLSTAGIVAAAAAMALQPDRAMAGMLAICTAVNAAQHADRFTFTALAASTIGFAATLARPDTLPAAPYVDQILYTSFGVHAGAGLAVLAGAALLLVPPVIGWIRDAENRAAYAAFGAAWLAAVIAAALGNYPTPIVGYGGSAIIGYALSLVALPRLPARNDAAASWAPVATDENSSDRQLLVALA